MNSKFLTLVVVAAVIAVGTYLGLNHLFPYQKEEAKVTAAVPVETVFSGGLQAPAAGEPTEAAAVPATAPADSGGVPTEAATVSPQAEQPAPEPQTAAKSEAAPAASKPENVATAEPAAAPKPEPAPKAEPPPAPAPAPNAESEKKPEPKPKPAEHAPSKAAAPAEPKPAVAPAKPAAAPAASKPAPAAAAPTPPATKVAVPPPAPAAQWWGAGDASHLSLVYAGSAAFQKAIVLMFNGEFASPDSANANLQVLDPKGAKASGSWKLGSNNKRMLVFPVNSAGKYTVIVKAGLKDSGGRTVAQEARGPVAVQ